VSAKASFTKLGSAGTPIRIRAFPGETPILDCSGESTGTDAISISGTYYRFYGLVFTNAGHNSILISGSNNIVERCVSLGARNTGFHITGGNGGTGMPSSNLFLNCDSIRSYDSPDGGDADGFSAKWSLGPGNVFSGCRAWENSDDNWDLWEGIAPILITNCWAFRAATNVYWDVATNTAFNGNGQGFKLGGAGTGAVHRVVGCLAFANKSYGIDQNNNADGQIVDQNTCWNNGSGAINLNHLGSQYGTLQSDHIVRNNVAIGSVAIGTNTTYPSLQASNTWQVLTSVNANDFLSVDYNAWVMAPRRDDGGLPDTPFLRPVPTGRLVDKGTNFGGRFVGSRPDLGAYETSVW
jgi:pectate disaccharide-lyase